MAGLVTDEFASTSAALISISDAEQGAVPSGTAIAENVFNSIYRTVRTADDLLAGVECARGAARPGHAQRSPRARVRAQGGSARRGAAVLPEDSDQHVRCDGARLRHARRGAAVTCARCSTRRPPTITATPPSAFFNSSILTPGVNLPNVVQLFRARYARMANDHATALAAANLVARTGTAALSVLTFPAPGVNFYANVTGGTNGIAPRRQWRLSMAPQDQRCGVLRRTRRRR